MALGYWIDWNTPAIRVIRDRVKTAVAYKQRKLFPILGYHPYCAFCGVSLLGRGEMHEFLITRGDAQGWSEDERLLIFTEINCVILHPACHHQFGQTEELKSVVGAHQIAIYGKQAFLDWLPTLPWRGNGAQEHINFVNSLGEIHHDPS